MIEQLKSKTRHCEEFLIIECLPQHETTHEFGEVSELEVEAFLEDELGQHYLEVVAVGDGSHDAVADELLLLVVAVLIVDVDEEDFVLEEGIQRQSALRFEVDVNPSVT